MTDEGPIRITPPTYPAQVDLRVDPSGAFRLPPVLPLEPATWTRDDRAREWLWLGPDEWLIVDDDGPAGPIIHELDAALDGYHRSIVDVSSNRAVIVLAGARRLTLLSGSCGIDLHPRAWQPGTCAQTLLAAAPVILQERGRDTRVFVRPSYLSYVTVLLGGPSQ